MVQHGDFDTEESCSMYAMKVVSKAILDAFKRGYENVEKGEELLRMFP